MKHGGLYAQESQTFLHYFNAVPLRISTHCSWGDMKSVLLNLSMTLKGIPRLLEEARAWPADQVIYWSEVARRYGVTKPNGRQYVKVVLAKFGIIAATRSQRKPKKSRKVLLPGIPFPMERSIKYHKQKIAEQIKDGKILQRE